MTKWPFILLLVIVTVTGVACTHAVSRRFIQPEEVPATLVAGWHVIPNVWAFEERINPDTRDHVYNISFEIQRPRPEDRDTLGSIELLELLQVEVHEEGKSKDTVLPVQLSVWVTNRSTRTVENVFRFGRLEVDSTTRVLTMRVTGLKQPGRHVLVGDVPKDSVVALNHGTADTVEIEVTLLQHDSKRLVPFFMKWTR